jgi:5-methylcytosine-specific restriction endonuclease McrA
MRTINKSREKENTMRDTFEKIQHFIATRVETAQEAEEIVKNLANVQWDKLVLPSKEEVPIDDKPIRVEIVVPLVYRKSKQQIMEDKKAKIKTLRALPYADYLKTPEWAKTRDATLRRARYRCQLCNTNRHLNVHHRSYESLGDENWNDLIVLCQECHKTFHDNRKLAKRADERIDENFLDQF